MLTDIFARRYQQVLLRDGFADRDNRLLVQAFRILEEDLFPYYSGGKETERGKAVWTDLHARLSRELGVTELSPVYSGYWTTWNGNRTWQSHKNTMMAVCKKWMLMPFEGSADQFIKERLSLVELAFRKREEELTPTKAAPPAALSHGAAQLLAIGKALPMPSNMPDRMREFRVGQYSAFRAAVEELNTRFRQANYSLHYHNGYIQAASDELIQQTVETPFWSLVADPTWANVDVDMKEALDRRDNGGRDPSFYAARALESTIKIISDLKQWTRGTESGAHGFIDNLGAKQNSFITSWESTILKEFFRHIRNPLGHGPGGGAMPQLTPQQTAWAIEFCMSWIKSLIRRL